VFCRQGRRVETSWAYIRLSDGRMIGIGQDISERKRLEASLRSQAEAERLLSAITQHIRQSLDLSQILATTVAEVQRNLQADRALILKFTETGSVKVIQSVAAPQYTICRAPSPSCRLCLERLLPPLPPGHPPHLRQGGGQRLPGTIHGNPGGAERSGGPHRLSRRPE
jgi:hypothetical protein